MSDQFPYILVQTQITAIPNQKEVIAMSSHKKTEIWFMTERDNMLALMPSYVKDYMRSIRNRTASRTQYEYLKDIQAFMDYEKGALSKDSLALDDISKLTKNDFEEYLEHLEHYEKNGRIVTNGRASIKRKLSSLRHFFSYLFENEYIPSDEIRKVNIPKLHKKDIVHLDDDEAANLLDDLEKGRALTKKEQDYHSKQSVRDLAIIYLLLSSGIRVSECAELDINDIDMKNCCVHIVRKGGDEATVYFSDEAAEYLQQYLDQRKDMKNVDENEKALFLSSRKKRMCVRAIEIMVKKHSARSVPTKKITPHKLRATFATSLYKKTGDIYLVAETLGHKDVATTKEHYANMSEEHKRENRNKVVFKNENDN